MPQIASASGLRSVAERILGNMIQLDVSSLKLIQTDCVWVF